MRLLMLEFMKICKISFINRNSANETELYIHKKEMNEQFHKIFFENK